MVIEEIALKRGFLFHDHLYLYKVQKLVLSLVYNLSNVPACVQLLEAAIILQRCVVLQRHSITEKKCKMLLSLCWRSRANCQSSIDCINMQLNGNLATHCYCGKCCMNGPFNYAWLWLQPCVSTSCIFIFMYIVWPTFCESRQWWNCSVCLQQRLLSEEVRADSPRCDYCGVVQ